MAKPKSVDTIAVASDMVSRIEVMQERARQRGGDPQWVEYHAHAIRRGEELLLGAWLKHSSQMPPLPELEVTTLTYSANDGSPAGWMSEDPPSPDRLRDVLKRDEAALREFIRAMWKRVPENIAGAGGSAIHTRDGLETDGKTLAAFGQVTEWARKLLATAGVADLLRGRRIWVARWVMPFQSLDDNPNVQGEYIQSGSRSYFTSDGVQHGLLGKKGDIGIRLGPVFPKRDNRDILAYLIHELGHAYFFEKLSAAERARWPEFFQKATGFVSRYARTNADEDFAELFTATVMKNRAPLGGPYSFDADAMERFRAFVAGAKGGFTEPRESTTSTPVGVLLEATETLYHGTTREFSRFDLAHAGKRDSGNLGRAVYLSRTPRMAMDYAEDNVKRWGGTPTVLKVQARLGKVANLDSAMRARLMRETGVSFPPQARDPERSEVLRRWFIEQGYDAVDNGDEVAVFEPTKLRVLGPVSVMTSVQRSAAIRAELASGKPDQAKLRRITAGLSETAPGDDYVIAPPGETGRVGPERGKPVANGVAKFTSPHGSYRYVWYENGVAVAGIQVMSRDRRNAVIAFVYTAPEQRRKGLAAKLLARARQDFKTIEHSDHLTDLGRAWRAGMNEGAVPQWVKAAEARGETFVGPNGNEAIGYEWKWKWGFKEDKREGGLVDARVSDWDSADNCITCNRSIVHIYWIKDKVTGEVAPYGVEHLHIALGYPRAVGKREQSDILKKIDARGLADKRVAGQIVRLTKKLAELRHKHEATTAKLAVWDRAVAIVAKMKEPPITFEIKKSVTGGEDIPVARMGDETVWLTFTKGKLDKEREDTLRRQWRDSMAADVYSRESGGDTYGDIRMRLDRQGVKTMAADIEKASKALHSLMPGKVTTDVAPAADEARQVPVGIPLVEGDTFKVKVDGQANIRGMLQHIADVAKIGHSFNVVVDPDDLEYRKAFSVDGDGSDRLALIDALKECAGEDGFVDMLGGMVERVRCAWCESEMAFDPRATVRGHLFLRGEAVGFCDGPDDEAACAKCFARGVLGERAKPPKAECRVCSKRISVNKDGTLGSHLRDVDGRRIHCPGSGARVSSPVAESTGDELIDEILAQLEQRELATAALLGQLGKLPREPRGIHLTPRRKSSGVTDLFVTKDTRRDVPGMPWRVTRMEKDEPVGHSNHATLEKAVRWVDQNYGGFYLENITEGEFVCSGFGQQHEAVRTVKAKALNASLARELSRIAANEKLRGVRIVVPLYNPDLPADAKPELSHDEYLITPARVTDKKLGGSPSTEGMRWRASYIEHTYVDPQHPERGTRAKPYGHGNFKTFKQAVDDIFDLANAEHRAVPVGSVEIMTETLDEAPAKPAKPKPPAGAKRGMKLVKITQQGAEKETGERERHVQSMNKIRRTTDDKKRQALLTTEGLDEAAMKVDDLPPGIGIQIARQPNNSVRVSYWHLGANRRAFKKQRDKVEGYILMAQETMMAKDIGACGDAYMVQWAGAVKGWGPLLYDVAVEVATKLGGGLMADRHSVSPDAHAVWQYYVTRRTDVKVHQLDTTDPEAKLTPRDPSDDCDQDTAKEYAGKGREDEWPEQPEAKRITKDNPTTLRALAASGRLVLYRFEPSTFGVQLAAV